MIWDEDLGEWVGYDYDLREPAGTPPELEDPDDESYPRSLWDPVEGWVDA